MSIRNGGKIIAGYGGTGGNGDSLKNQNPTSDIKQVYDWVGTLEEYTSQDVANLHPTWVCFIIDDTIPKDMTLYTNRNVGDIFFTTRLDEELNGAVECNGAIHSFEDFVGKDSIGNLLADGKLPYVSLTEYATLLSTNGVVGVFGWDGGNNTNFRVPTIKDVFLEAGEALEIGDYIDAGLPDHNHMIQISYDTDGNFASSYPKAGNTVILYKEGVSPASKNGPKGVNRDYGVLGTFGDRTTDYNEYRDTEFIGSVNDTKSPLYGKSTTVQPKAVKYRAMVQLVIGFSDHAVEDCKFVKSSVENLNEEVDSLNEHALLDNRITNCITNIPQDIKLEKDDVNNRIIIKAGSKLYYPDGFEADGVTKKFSSVVLSEDVYDTDIQGQKRIFLVCRLNDLSNIRANTAYVDRSNATSQGSESGTGPTPDAATHLHCLYYNLTDNKIYFIMEDSTVQVTFPLCIENVDATTSPVTKSIEQVFNGFGYIGACMYALPGVSVLFPDGFNEDGSYKSNLEILNKITIWDNEGIGNAGHVYSGIGLRRYAKNNIFISRSGHGFITVDILPDTSKVPENYKGSTRYYVRTKNKYYQCDNIDGNWCWVEEQWVDCGTSKYDLTNKKYTNINTRNVYRVTDFNEFNDHRVVLYQKPDTNDNKIWFRLYSDGWVEQGGNILNVAMDTSHTVTFPIPMKQGTHYFAVVSTDTFMSANGYIDRIGTRTSTGMTITYDMFAPTTHTVHKMWYVCGSADV